MSCIPFLSPCSHRCNVSTTELRRAAIHLLLSMLCLPLHFQDLPIKGVKYFANTSSQTALVFVILLKIIIKEVCLEFGSFWLLPEFTVTDIPLLLSRAISFLVEAVWPSGWSAGLVIQKPWVQVPPWLLAWFVLGSSKFKSLATLVNSQLVCLLSVGILKHIIFYCFF